LRSNASRREEFPALHVDLRYANQHPGGGPWLISCQTGGLKFGRVHSTLPHFRLVLTSTSTHAPSAVWIIQKIRITIIFYKSTHPYSRKRALHFRRKAKSFILRSNASRREEFPALHVDLRHANQHPGGGPWLTAIKILGKN